MFYSRGINKYISYEYRDVDYDYLCVYYYLTCFLYYIIRNIFNSKYVYWWFRDLGNPAVQIINNLHAIPEFEKGRRHVRTHSWHPADHFWINIFQLNFEIFSLLMSYTQSIDCVKHIVYLPVFTEFVIYPPGEREKKIDSPYFTILERYSFHGC